MRIRHLDITNFRGFEHKSFDFDERLTVIVGNNTAGKTTLLQAIQVALGAYLKCLKSLPHDKAYAHNFSPDDEYSRYDGEKKDFFKNEGPARIDAIGEYLCQDYVDGSLSEAINKNISWWREYKGGKTTHSNECAGEMISCVDEMVETRNKAGHNSIYPLVLSFGANRIENQYRAARKTKEHESKITRAYKSALKETVDFQGAFDWMYRYEQNRKKNVVFEGNDKALYKALEKAIPALSDITVDTKNAELSALVSVAGREPEYQTYEHMSDGFKSMISMVAEIAHRCIELNDFLGEEAVERTPGVVVIDELDLYLHPRWQRHVLNDLCKAFPMIQFIVTSHSPFIIQSVRSRNLITLDGISDATDPLYRSIEEIVIKEMNMDTPRSERYDRMLDLAEEYYHLVKSGNADAAARSEALLMQLEAEFSDDPAYLALLRSERGQKG